MSQVPTDRRYTQSHEWAQKEKDTLVTVGITEHAQHLLGDIVFVELPTVGAVVNKGQECAVIESVKAASDIYSPVSGEIIAVNTNLSDAPETVNSDPYKDGWLFQVKMKQLEEFDTLLEAQTYDSQIQEEA
jgi:glycine cleavage system H protein